MLDPCQPQRYEAPNDAGLFCCFRQSRMRALLIWITLLTSNREYQTMSTHVACRERAERCGAKHSSSGRRLGNPGVPSKKCTLDIFKLCFDI